MAEYTNVKKLLRLSNSPNHAHTLAQAIEELATMRGSAEGAPPELCILAAELAIGQNRWTLAEAALDLCAGDGESELLAMRRQYCRLQARVHNTDGDPHFSDEARTEVRLECVACVLQDLTLSVPGWPDSKDSVLESIRVAWKLIEPLYTSFRYRAICDTVVFLCLLHEQLAIGGGAVFIEWHMRSVACLRDAGRFNEAVAHFQRAMIAASLLNNENRLVQVFRVGAIAQWERESLAQKSKVDVLALYQQLPVYHVVQLTQLLLSEKLVDANGHLDQLLGAVSQVQMLAYPSKEAAGGAAAPSPEPQPKGKGRGGGAGGTSKASASSVPTATDYPTIKDTDVLEKVLVEALCCLFVFGRGTECEELRKKLSLSSQRQVRSVLVFVRALDELRFMGAQMGLASQFVPPPTTPSNVEHLVELVKSVEEALSWTKKIAEENEKNYLCRLGCNVQWMCLLPLLHTPAKRLVQPAIHRLTESAKYDAGLTKLFLQAGIQSCQLVFGEGNRLELESLASQLLGRLHSVEARGEVVVPPSYEFQLLWLLHRAKVREESEMMLKTLDDKCLLQLEQARTCSNASKRIALIRTAVQRLPPLSNSDDNSERELSKGGTGATLPPLRSRIQLYYEMLVEGLKDLGTTLLPHLKHLAESLDTLDPDADCEDASLKRIRAESVMALCTFFLFEQESKGKRASNVDEPEFLRNVMKVMQLGCDLAALGGGGQRLCLFAVTAFLQNRAPIFAVGKFDVHTEEAGTLHDMFLAAIDTPNFCEGAPSGKAEVLRVMAEFAESHAISLVHMFLLQKQEARQITGYDAANAACGHSPAEELLRFSSSLPKPDPGNPILKRALAHLQSSMTRISKMHIKWRLVTLSAIIQRLLNEKVVPQLQSPQEQVLSTLGRLRAPMTDGEQRATLTTELIPNLMADPSVQLCYHVAVVAQRLGLDGIVLKLCQTADGLYTSGRLGWSTGHVLPSPSQGTSAGANEGTAPVGGKTSQPKITPSPSCIPGEAVKPATGDWDAYALLLLMQANALRGELRGLPNEEAQELSLYILGCCVNSAIAASHGSPCRTCPMSATVHGLLAPYVVFHATVHDSFSVVYRNESLLPSLKILFSKSLLLHVLPSQGRYITAQQRESVYELCRLYIHLGGPTAELDWTKLREVFSATQMNSLKAMETQTAAAPRSTFDTFLTSSKSLSAELQVAGWVRVAQVTRSETKRSQAWALAAAAAATTGGGYLTASVYYEMAVSGLAAGSATSKDEPQRQLLTALQSLERLKRTPHFLSRSCEGSFVTHGTLPKEATSCAFLLTMSDGGAGSLRKTLSGVRPRARRDGGSPSSMAFRDAVLGIKIARALYSCGGWKTHEKDAISDLPDGGARDVAFLFAHYIRCFLQLVHTSVLAGSDESTKRPVSPRHEDAAAVAADSAPVECPLTISEWDKIPLPMSLVEEMRAVWVETVGPRGCASLVEYTLSMVDFFIYERAVGEALAACSWAVLAAEVVFGVGDVRSKVVRRASSLLTFRASSELEQQSDASLSQERCAYTSAAVGERNIELELFVKAHLGDKAAKEARWVLRLFLLEADLLIQCGKLDLACQIGAQVSQLITYVEENCPKAKMHDVSVRADLVAAFYFHSCQRTAEAVSLLDKHLLNDCSSFSTGEKESATRGETFLQLSEAKFYFLVTTGDDDAALAWYGSFKLAMGTWAVPPQGAKVHFFRRCASLCAQKLASCPVAQSAGINAAHRGGVAFQSLARASSNDLRGESGHVLDRVLAAFVLFHLREVVDETWLLAHEDSVADAREQLGWLTDFLTTCEELFTEVSEHKASHAKHAHTARDEALLQYMMATARFEITRLCELVLCTYRGLTLDDLHLPSTTAPVALEEKVLEFMRGATEASASTDIVASEVPNEEMKQALLHFSIDVSVLDRVGKAEAGSILWSANEKVAFARDDLLHADILHSMASVLSDRILRETAQAESGQYIPVPCEWLFSSAAEEKRRKRTEELWNRVPVLDVAPEKGKNASRARGNSTAVSGNVKKNAAAGKNADAAPENELQLPERELVAEAERLSFSLAGRLQLACLTQLCVAVAQVCGLRGCRDECARWLERAQSAEMYAELLGSTRNSMKTCKEIRMWRSLELLHPAFLGSLFERECAAQLRLESPMIRQVDSVFSSLSAEVPRLFMADGPVISVIALRHMYCVALRHPQGAGEVRVKVESAAAEAVAQLVGLSQRCAEATAQQLGGDGALPASTLCEGTSASITEVNNFLVALLAPFLPAVLHYCAKAPLYLCVSPVLQPLPLGRAAVFSPCYAVLRELCAANVTLKGNSRAASPISSRAAANLAVQLPSYLVDPYGEHPASVETLFAGAETSSTSKIRGAQAQLLSCTAPGIPLSNAYVEQLWTASPPSALLVDMCGPLTEFLSLGTLAALHLEAVGSILLADGGVCARSAARLEASQLKQSADTMANKTQLNAWLVPLLCMARGARFVAANSFPKSPAELDAICKRCITLLSSSKSLLDVCVGKSTRDGKGYSMELYGVASNFSKGAKN